MNHVKDSTFVVKEIYNTIIYKFSVNVVFIQETTSNSKYMVSQDGISNKRWYILKQKAS